MCGAQEIYYTLNNRNEFNFMDALIMFLGAQEPQSNKTKSEEFANPTFFRDALYTHMFTHMYILMFTNICLQTSLPTFTHMLTLIY